MSPETDGEFFRRKWIIGGSGFLIIAYGLVAIWTTSSYDVVYSTLMEHSEFFKVDGIVAVGSGIQYIGIGTLLVSYFFLPYSGWARYHVALQRIGWTTAAIGFGIFIFSFMGLYDSSSQ